mmetsp:Transcript_3297/g.5383  ORF Transcript_3297/g.5383 Transcript_3297/m.5383 type:complete len:123 (+) Transcript_3297:158-526(+)
MNAHSFSLARRLTDRNEPDLLHESFSDDSSPPGSPVYSKEFCQALVDKMCVDSTLPSECVKFPNLLSEVKRRNSDRSNQAIAFQGMSAGEQAAAMSARDKGKLNHAQIQRRLTSSRRTFQKR